MDFTVHTPDSEEPFHGESSYSIQDGVLIVRSDAGKQVTYSPLFWQRVIEDGPTGGWIVEL